MAGIIFAPAQRSKAKLRLAVTGPSGSGKTMRSLLIARGIAGESGRIAVCDTETQSASLYAHVTAFDTVSLDAPYTVDKFVDVIHAAEDAGYDVLILDSISPVWKGQGGLLEQQEMAASASRNSFSSWKGVTKDYQKLISAVTGSKIHIIATMRSQTAYEMENVDGTRRSSPVKVGLKPEMRDGFDYEFTTVLNLTATSAGHLATVSKDRTNLFDQATPFVPTIETGRRIAEWLENGTEAAAVPSVPDKAEPAEVLSPALVTSRKERAAANPKPVTESEAAVKKDFDAITGANATCPKCGKPSMTAKDLKQLKDLADGNTAGLDEKWCTDCAREWWNHRGSQKVKQDTCDFTEAASMIRQTGLPENEMKALMEKARIGKVFDRTMLEAILNGRE